MSPAALEVHNLKVDYPIRSAVPFRRLPPRTVVDGVSFSLSEGETLALVGESGSGKTTIGNAILGLAPVAGGTVRLTGADITRLPRNQRRAVAADLQVVFQNPYGSLNPSLTIGAILSEPLRVHRHFSRSESRDEIADLLLKVGMPADSATRYPESFSGGQRQRIAIARALAVRPKVIVCDEPTSALDVSTQATVLKLLADLQRDTGVAYLFITHDLAVAKEFAHRVAVLNRGTIVEVGSSHDVCDAPQHPYTARLVAAAPVPDPLIQRERRRARQQAARAAV